MAHGGPEGVRGRHWEHFWCTFGAHWEHFGALVELFSSPGPPLGSIVVVLVETAANQGRESIKNVFFKQSVKKHVSNFVFLVAICGFK